MASKAVGKLYIDIEARTAEFEESLEKVKTNLAKLQDKVSGVGKSASLDAIGLKFLKFNLYAQLSANAVQALGKAIADVNNNAEMLGRAGLIRGDAVVALQEASVGWSKAKETLSGLYSEFVRVAAGAWDFNEAMKEQGKIPWKSGSIASQVASKLEEFVPKTSMLDPFIAMGRTAQDAFAAKRSEAEDRAVAAAGGQAEYLKALEQAKAANRVKQTEADLASLDRAEKLTLLEKLRARAVTMQAETTNRSELERARLVGHILDLEKEIGGVRKDSRGAAIEAMKGWDTAVQKQGEVGKNLTDKIADLEALKAGILNSGVVERAKAAREGKGVIGKEDQAEMQRLVDIENQLTSARTTLVAKTQEAEMAVRAYTEAERDAAMAGKADAERVAQMRETLASLNIDAIKAKKESGAELSAEEIRNLQEGVTLKSQIAALDARILENLRAIREEEERTQETLTLQKLNRQEQINYLKQLADAARGRYLAESDSGKKKTYFSEATRFDTQAGALTARYGEEDANAIRKYQEAIERSTRKTLEPQQEYAENLRKIIDLQARHSALFVGDKRTETALTKEELRDLQTLTELQTRNIELADKQRDAYRQLGESMASTFYDGIVAGEKLDTVLKRMLADLLRYIAQQTVMKSVGNMTANLVGGWFAGAGKGAPSSSGDFSTSTAGSIMAGAGFSGGPRASGGPVVPGATYQVNERGQEFFTPSSYGYITPAERVSSAPSGSGGGITYAPVYNVAAGVTQNELMPILRAHAQQVRASISDDLRRGGMRAAQFR